MVDDVKNIIAHYVVVVNAISVSRVSLGNLITVANRLAFSLLEFQVALWIQIFEVDVDVSAPCMAYCRSGSSGGILPVPRRH